MIEWVPTYESLYDAEKLGLRHTARSVYTGLCIKARKDRGDRVRLPRGRELVTGVHQLVGGLPEEVGDALRDDPCGLLYPKDPMIAVEGEEGALVVVILRRERWALDGDREPTPAPTGPIDARTRRRLADAERKRAARRATKVADAQDGSAEGDVVASASVSGRDADMTADASASVSGRAAHAGGVRGGVSDLQTQKRTEERTGEESEDTRTDVSGRDADMTADASADGRRADTGRVGEVVTTESLLAAVARHPMLSALHGDRQWAMRAVGGLQAAACRSEDASAAVDAFVVDHAASAPPDGQALAAFVRGSIGRYLKGAKRHGDEARARQRPVSEATMPADTRATLEVFGEVWARRKRRAFVASAGDEKTAAELAAAAREHAGKLKMRPSDIVRFWAEKHLGSQDRLVVDSDHALRTLRLQLTSYGLPPPPPRPAAASAAPAEPPAPPPPGIAAAISGVGTSGNAMAPRRPS